nr:MAG TPA: hypothetical protein [Caudoviricetes sp.]
MKAARASCTSSSVRAADSSAETLALASVVSASSRACSSLSRLEPSLRKWMIIELLAVPSRIC